MDVSARRSIVAELAATVGGARDLSPTPEQPLHVLLPKLALPPPWRPSPAKALLRFASWPATRPEFYIDPEVVNADGVPPYSNFEQLILGETWRGFSFQFPWSGGMSATKAVQLWLGRFQRAR